MPGGTVHYNLKLGLIAAKATTPTWLAIYGPINWDITNSQDVEYLDAGGKKNYPAWGAPQFGFNASFAEADFALLAIINNGVASTSGTTPAIIERFNLKGTVGNPVFHFSGYTDNVNGNASRNGFRLTVPLCTASAAVPRVGQKAYGTWPIDGAIQTRDTDDVAVIFEKLESAPTLTAGVYTPALT